jgi:hypothetical protein
MKHSLVLLTFAVGAGFLAGHITRPDNEIVFRAEAPVVVGADATLEPPKEAGPEDGKEMGKFLPTVDKESALASAKVLSANLTSAAQLEKLFDLLRTWAICDPDAALAFALENLKLRRQEQAVRAMLGDWTERNPQAAWNWATNGNPQFVDAVLSQLGKTDGTKAWEFATAYAANHTNVARSTYVGALRGMTYAGDFANAARLLQEDKLLSAGDRTAVASLLIASEWGRNDPQGAAEWAGSLAKDDPIRERVLAQLGAAWSSVNPSGAAEFGAQLPIGEARREVVTRAINNWIDRDPIAVGEFLKNLPSSPDFDEAIRRFATHPTIVTETATAIGWAQLITDAEQRTQALVEIINSWMLRDSAAAAEYLQNTRDISPNLRAEIQGRIANQDLYSSRRD